MAHNGIARSQRLTRLMKQKHRKLHEGVELASQAGEESAGSLISSMKKAHILDHGSSGEGSHKDSDHLLGKRQDSAVPPEPQTAAPATVASVVDAPPDTAAALPTSISDSAPSQPTVSVPAETPSAPMPPISSLIEFPPSPGPITADTSATASANDLTIVLTASVSLSLDISVSISGSIPTSTAIISSASGTQSSALIPSARSSSAVSSSTPIASPKPTSTASSLSSSACTSTVNGTSSYGSYGSTSSDYPGDYSTTSVSEATTTADLYSTGTYLGGGDPGATATGQAPSATTSSSSGGGLDSVTTKRILGGVVGGLAGAFFLLGLLLFLLRRRKTALFGPNRGLPASDGTGGTAGEVSRTEMASRRSSRDPLFTASYFAPAFVKRWRHSNQTVRSDDSTLTTTTTSERGFQKISGRKIPSVLQSGGDGYGGGFDQGSPTASEPSMSLPPGSPVQPRSIISQPPPSMPYGMPLDVSYTREADEPESVVIIRPSPARTPVASSTNVSVVNASRATPQPGGTLSPTLPHRPDGLGRSHPSFDGSRGSRFTESLDGL